jgi:photosystem II stability/assembly factor-like uncharacterized protein
VKIKMKYLYTCLILIFLNNTGFSQGTWTDLSINPAPPQLNSVSTISPEAAWAAGNEGTVIFTSDKGISWSSRGGGAIGTLNIFTIAAFDTLTAICGAYGDGLTAIFKTTSGGMNWFQVFSQTGGFIDDIRMVNSLTGYAYGDPVNGKWTLLKTINGGTTWDSSGMNLVSRPGEYGWWNNMCVYHPLTGNDIIWFGTGDSIIYRSNNSGLNWIGLHVPQRNIFSIAFFDQNTGFCGSDYFVCKSTNGGDSWSIINVPANGPINSMVCHSGKFWFTGDNRIIGSIDGGFNFFTQHISPGNTAYRQMSFSYSSTDEILTDFGGYAITAETYAARYAEINIGIHQPEDQVPQAYKLEQNYPNPFNPVTKINFEIPLLRGVDAPACFSTSQRLEGVVDMQEAGRGVFVKLTIYDILGKEVAVLVNGEYKAGSYEITWNALNCSSGVYFYALSADNFNQTKKMVLLK